MPQLTVESSTDRKIVLVIGHGLAGKMTVEALAKKKDIRIIVVESREFCEVDCLAPTFLSRPEYYSKLSAPQALSRRPDVTYVHATVANLEEAEGSAHRFTVALQTGEKLSADAVVCCVGSHIPLLKPELGVSANARRNELDAARAEIKKAKSILVVGGGSVGVELAGTVVELKSAGCSVKLAVSGETVLHDGFSMAARKRLARHMESQGIEILPATKVIGPDLPLTFRAKPGATYELNDGGTVQADVLLPSFSTFSMPFLPEPSLTDERGRLVVDTALQSPKLRGVFGVACVAIDQMINSMSNAAAPTRTR